MRQTPLGGEKRAAGASGDCRKFQKSGFAGVDGHEMSSILADSLARAAKQPGPLPKATAPSALFKNQQVICVGTRVLRHMTQNASSKYPSQFINRLKQAMVSCSWSFGQAASSYLAKFN